MLRSRLTLLAPLFIAAACAGTQTVEQDPTAKPLTPEPVVIHDYLGQLLLASQNEVVDSADFTRIHDGTRAALRRFDVDGDGLISAGNPRERDAHGTISRLQQIGAVILIGPEDMKDPVAYDHETRHLYIHPSLEAAQAAMYLTRFMDKHPEYWELIARGAPEWTPPVPVTDAPGMVNDR